jgi:hypothetical protein
MLTQTRLRHLLHYDPQTGSFTWLDCPRKHLTGQPPGYLCRGYRLIQLDGRSYRAHRLAWLYFYGQWPPGQLDHKNLLRDDNRITNLRQATHTQNMQNVPLKSNNFSGVKGVHWDARNSKWMARIRTGGARLYLGLFDSLEDAAEAVRLKRIELHGTFANHG